MAEGERLDTLIQTGKRAARQVLKARILLKADAAGEGWSDSQIAAALETSLDTVARTRQRLVEEGLHFARLGPATHLRWRGRGQADCPGLFGTAQGTRPVDAEALGSGGGRTEHRHARQRQHASGNMGGRTLKKTRSSPTSKSNGSFHPMPTPPS